MSFVISDAALENYEIIHSGIPYFGGGSITTDNVFWVRKAGHVQAWLNTRPGGFSKATLRQCEMIWGAFVRTKDAVSTDWQNEQTMATGIKTPIVPADFLEYKRSGVQRRSQPETGLKLNKISGVLMRHLKWVFNTKSLPTKAEMVLSVYRTPAFLNKTTVPLRAAINTAYEQVVCDPRLSAQLYCPQLMGVTKAEDLTALRYHGVPVAGFVLRLWHALHGATANESKVGRQGPR